MSTDNFLAAVKVKRDEAVDYFQSEDFFQAISNGVEEPVEVIRKGVDTLVGNLLDVLSDQYEDIVSADATDNEGSDVTINLGIASDLSTLYFEMVSS